MPTLHSPSAAPTAPYLNAKLNPLHPGLRNLGLKLGNRLALFQPTTTAWTLRRQRYFYYFVDSLRDWPTTAPPVPRTAFASRSLGMDFGFLSREGSRLAFTRSQSFFQHLSQPFDLGF
jgi:hypothetical protein